MQKPGFYASGNMKGNGLLILKMALEANPNEYEWDKCPLFGGEEPDDTTGILSWDPTHLLIGTCADDLQIISRQEWFSCP